MKKTFLKIAFILIAISCIAFLSIKTYHKLETKRTAEANSKQLPAFSFYKLDGSLLKRDGLSYGDDKILINYFNPDCEHCHYMAGQMKKKKAAFSGITILMITTADSLPAKEFAKKYELENTPGIIILRDPTYTFNSLFGSSVVPSFFLYKNNGLVRKITGETKIENLVAF